MESCHLSGMPSSIEPTLGTGEGVNQVRIQVKGILVRHLRYRLKLEVCLALREAAEKPGWLEQSK